MLMAVDDEISFGAVRLAYSNGLPEGDAHPAWTKLGGINAKKSTNRKS